MRVKIIYCSEGGLSFNRKAWVMDGLCEIAARNVAHELYP